MSFFVRKVLASLISHIQLPVLELLVENFRTEACENCIPRVSIRKFWWKTNVLNKCNFSNSFLLWARKVRIFGHGSGGDVKLHWRVRKKFLGNFFTEKFSNLSLFSIFQQKFFELLKKILKSFLKLHFTCPEKIFEEKNIFEKTFLKKVYFLKFSRM